MPHQNPVNQFVIALLKSRNVQFGEVAQHLNDAVRVASNETRIQDFFRETDLNYLVLAQLLLTLLPAPGKLRLYLDRTEWDVGRCQINSLLVTAGRGSFSYPSTGNCSTIAAAIPAPPTASPCCKSASSCWVRTASG